MAHKYIIVSDSGNHLIFGFRA